MTSPIPQPPAIPLLGNAIGTLDKDVPTESMYLLAKQYGSVYLLNILGTSFVVVNSQKLSHEVADEKRFKKAIIRNISEVRNLLGDALFTAHKDEPAWILAHKLLMPCFGPQKIRGMFDEMTDISSQLILKWKRFGPQHPINVPDDFTRLTFETIALCLYGHRFNSFYVGDMPFVDAMGSFLIESGNRANRFSVVQAMMTSTNKQYQADMKLMLDTAGEILAYRKANPSDHDDLLNVMLQYKNPSTGEGIPEDNIIRNMVTFLIAGHETTSGLLSFALYHLLKTPSAYAKLRAEIDEVLGDRPVTYVDLGNLKYVQAVLRETLRLTPSVPARSAQSMVDTVIDDGEKKYAIGAGTNFLVQIRAIHHDPKVWGDDHEQFRPERMSDENMADLPPDSYVPWGNGVRACIGRALAWQEAQICLASIIQHFDFYMHDPSYILNFRQTLTIKPKGFYVHAVPRKDGKVPAMFASPTVTMRTNIPEGVQPTSMANDPVGEGGAQPLFVLYGSNSGSCESFAQRIVADAPAKGFRATIGTLNSAVEHIPTTGPVVIVTASFEGEPAENAGHFVEYIKQLSGKELSGVKYAVFGCGNHDWVSTYQKIPKLCDQIIGDRGGERLLQRGEADAGGSLFFDDFDAWESKLWSTLHEKYQVNLKSDFPNANPFECALSKGTERAEHLRQADAELGTVVENRLLTKEGVPVKRHVEIALPEDFVYRSGDYLAILPTNPKESVRRVLTHFKLSPEQQVTIKSNTPTSLPTDQPFPITQLLEGYVEISQPATKRGLQELLHYASPNAKAELESLISSFTAAVREKRLSILDILELHPGIDVPFSVFLSLLPAMRVRQYSISSSPLWKANHVTLTVGVLDGPSLLGKPGSFLGVASNYLAQLHNGDRIQVSVRPSAAPFHLPTDPSVPIVMFCAGSGIAPMRGFIQERAYQAKSGRNVAKSLLFFGCRNPDEDFLYSNTELKEWADLGVVQVFPAFSRASDLSEGCKYVQDRVWKERDAIRQAFSEGAKFYTCGSNHVAKGIKDSCLHILKEARGVDDEAAATLFSSIQKERYSTDVFD